MNSAPVFAASVWTYASPRARRRPEATRWRGCRSSSQRRARAGSCCQQSFDRDCRRQAGATISDSTVVEPRRAREASVSEQAKPISPVRGRRRDPHGGCVAKSRMRTPRGMDASDVQALLGELSQLRADEIGRLIERLKRASTAPPGSEIAATALPVNVEITLVPASKTSLDRVAKDPQVAGSLPISVPPQLLSAELLAALERAQPVVLRALADPAEAALFAANPLAALKRIAAELDPRLMHMLEAAHAKALTPPPPVGLRLQRLTVKVQPGTGRPG
jgi:hypothetical protein